MENLEAKLLEINKAEGYRLLSTEDVSQLDLPPVEPSVQALKQRKLSLPNNKLLAKIITQGVQS